MGLLDLLRLPETRGIANLDDPAVTLLHGRIIRSKPFLRAFYRDMYLWFKAELPPSPQHPLIVELGSGGGFIKEVIPHAITSDVLKIPALDLCFSALNVPFDDGSVDAFLMIDVLHHLPDVKRFFSEAQRTLKPGGRILMVEPANTPWGRFIYTHFHHEPFVPEGSWKLDGAGPLSSANGAIPWIVLCRDRDRFQREFAELRMLSMRAHTPLRYLLSGGVSMRQLLPSFAYPLVRAAERILSPANNIMGMFYSIALHKVGGTPCKSG